MIRTTLCTPPSGWDAQIQRLVDIDKLPPDTARTLLSVELCLRLVEFLGKQDETIAVVPALLSGLPIHGVTWTSDERRAIANVRQIARYGSPSAWRNALETYAVIPEELRRYRFPDLPIPDEDEQEKKHKAARRARRVSPSKWLVALLETINTETTRYAQQDSLYWRALTEILPYRKHQVAWAKAGETYNFSVNSAEGGRQTLKVTFPAELPMLNQAPWFEGLPPRDREPVTVHLRIDLEPEARNLDEIDARSGRPNRDWVRRLARVRYRRVSESGAIEEGDPDVITLDGFHHAAGMVASGKSTLAFLLAAWVIRTRKDLRLCLVVGDVQSSLRLADELNTYFGPDIEADTPVAVPLLGRSSRDKHLRDLHGSREYHEKRLAGQGHWGERFLSVACPLQALVPETAEKPLAPGTEPCSSLRPLPSTKRRRGAAPDTPESPSEKRFLCPLYSHCPVQQGYRDMVSARVWITNPWAMAYGSLPRQVEPRPVHLGEIIYEQCNIVLFDEADALMGVFDEVFAEVAQLTNGKDGIYDRIGVQTEEFTVRRRSDAGSHRIRWSVAQRHGQSASMTLLSLLTDPTTAFLRRWLERTQFTPHSLMARIARMACGLADFSSKEEETSDLKRADDAFEPFRLLFESGGDPLDQKWLKPNARVPAQVQAYYLGQLLTDLALGKDVFGTSLLSSAQEWLKDTYPNIEKNIEALNAQRKARKTDKNFENLNRVAYRLLLALAAALLDRNTEIVLYEWYNRAAPDEEEGEPHRRMPAVLTDILPLPPVGRQFGTYFAPGDGSDRRSANLLQYLSYTNIGRWYLLHFYHLRADLEGVLGPHVLALSGTSYLPDSVRLHVGTYGQKPQGLLLPEDQAASAIQDSKFHFLPLAGSDQKPIRVSGTSEWEKPAALKALATALCSSHSGNKLALELSELERLGREQSALWSDRTRLLLLTNSYDQAKIVADTLRREWPAEATRIYHLARIGSTREGEELVGGSDATALKRTDIETFALTGGRVLIAPINSIGRGFNILNRNTPPLAAFGAVYFLVRPYPHPDDMTALARELNRRTLDWAERESFSAWNYPSVEEKFRALHRTASDYWHDMERRKYWSTLHERSQWLCDPKKDLAAFTAGIIVQAAGRLLRGGVPFHAFFCDAAFASHTAHWYCSSDESDAPAEPDAPANSLLAAVIDLLRESVATDAVAKALYAPLSDALCDLKVGVGAKYYPFESKSYWKKPRKSNS